MVVEVIRVVNGVNNVVSRDGCGVCVRRSMHASSMHVWHRPGKGVTKGMLGFDSNAAAKTNHMHADQHAACARVRAVFAPRASNHTSKRGSTLRARQTNLLNDFFLLLWSTNSVDRAEASTWVGERRSVAWRKIGWEGACVAGWAQRLEGRRTQVRVHVQRAPCPSMVVGIQAPHRVPS